MAELVQVVEILLLIQRQLISPNHKQRLLVLDYSSMGMPRKKELAKLRKQRRQKMKPRQKESLKNWQQTIKLLSMTLLVNILLQLSNSHSMMNISRLNMKHLSRLSQKSKKRLSKRFLNENQTLINLVYFQTYLHNLAERHLVKIRRAEMLQL